MALLTIRPWCMPRLMALRMCTVEVAIEGPCFFLYRLVEKLYSRLVSLYLSWLNWPDSIHARSPTLHPSHANNTVQKACAENVQRLSQGKACAAILSENETLSEETIDTCLLCRSRTDGLGVSYSSCKKGRAGQSAGTAELSSMSI